MIEQTGNQPSLEDGLTSQFYDVCREYLSAVTFSMSRDDPTHQAQNDGRSRFAKLRNVRSYSTTTTEYKSSYDLEAINLAINCGSSLTPMELIITERITNAIRAFVVHYEAHAEPLLSKSAQEALIEGLPTVFRSAVTNLLGLSNDTLTGREKRIAEALKKLERFPIEKFELSH